MIKINLLSPADKTSAKWEKINSSIIFNFLILIIGQFVLVFMFLISIKYLDVENNDLNKQLENMQVQSEIREVEEIKTSIREYDKQLKTILELQEDRSIFTGVLEDFSKIIFVGVKINSIDIKPKISETVNKTKRGSNEIKDTSKIGKFDFNITGTVKDRESLLKFENNLRNSEVFIDLIIDLSNYDNENNDFRYSMTIDVS
ncbi:hypothetical protein KAK05_02585 [Candidatus Parcubacteria bacterium]|nr:hypothetical protein [Candidatus Parcubacteria bacterium]